MIFSYCPVKNKIGCKFSLAIEENLPNQLQAKIKN